MSIFRSKEPVKHSLVIEQPIGNPLTNSYKRVFSSECGGFIIEKEVRGRVVFDDFDYSKEVVKDLYDSMR